MLSAALTGGCAHARTGQAVVPPRRNGWIVVPHVSVVAQEDDADCGPAALATALTRWGLAPAADAWRPRVNENRLRAGFTAASLREEARRAGVRAFVFEGTFDDLDAEIAAGDPVIVGLVHIEHEERVPHFAVVVGHDTGGRHWLLADPALGIRSVTQDDLRTEWGHSGWVTLVLLAKAPDTQ
jgi:predicted double-glycine peptidase